MDSPGWDLIAADGTRLGRLEPAAAGGDMFWTGARFTPAPAFAQVAPLFAAELELLNREEMEAWDEAYGRIDALALELRPVDGGAPIREFILHIDGGEAWFRH